MERDRLHYLAKMCNNSIMLIESSKISCLANRLSTNSLEKKKENQQKTNQQRVKLYMPGKKFYRTKKKHTLGGGLERV